MNIASIWSLYQNDRVSTFGVSPKSYTEAPSVI